MKDIDIAYGVSYINKQRLIMEIQEYPMNREWAATFILKL